MTGSVGNDQQGPSARHRYNRWSRYYNWLSSAGERRLQRAGIEMLAGNPDERILDLGCGTGTAQFEMVHTLPETTCYGIDLSEGMLHVARRSATRDGQAFHLVQGDLHHLPVSTGAADAVFMSFTLELFPEDDLERVLGEVRRVLSNGGRLVLVCMANTIPKTWILRLYEWLHLHLPDWVDCRPIDARSWLLRADFRIEQVQRKSIFGLPVDIIAAQVD